MNPFRIAVLLCCLGSQMLFGCDAEELRADAGIDASTIAFDAGTASDGGTASDAGTSLPDTGLADSGAFDAGFSRDAGSTCVPDCSATECGLDPRCGVSCGTCAAGRTCNAAGLCECVPSCGGRECGADPSCGASCGTCSGADICSAAGRCECVARCSGLECGVDPVCGTSCGSCGSGSCVDGDCIDLADYPIDTMLGMRSRSDALATARVPGARLVTVSAWGLRTDGRIDLQRLTEGQWRFFYRTSTTRIIVDWRSIDRSPDENPRFIESSRSPSFDALPTSGLLDSPAAVSTFSSRCSRPVAGTGDDTLRYYVPGTGDRPRVVVRNLTETVELYADDLSEARACRPR